MEFSVSNQELLKVLRKCGHALERNTTIPILSTFLVQVKGKWLTCTSTDLQLAVRCSVECAAATEGSVCLPGEKFVSIIAALNPTDTVSFKLNDEKRSVQISCGRSKFRLAGEDPKTFPEVLDTPDNEVEFNSKLFLKAVSRCVFIIEKLQESRNTLPAILIESKDGKLAIAGTDTHRIGVSQWDQEARNFKDLIPRETARALGQVFSEEDTIGFAVDDNHLWFQQPNIVLATRKTVGSFPDWRRILNVAYPHHLSMKSEDFKRSMQRATVCAASSKDIKAAVDMHFDRADLTLFGQDAANGSESSEVVEIQYDGEPFDARFDGSYLADALTAIDSADVLLSFKDGKQSFQLEPVPEDGYKYVVMPRMMEKKR